MKCIKCNTKNHAPRRRICYRCAKREYRAAHPITAAFQTLKDNAKRRGKDFNLQLDWFIEFATRHEYIENRGRTGASLQIDRIDHERGYNPDNIQVITAIANQPASKEPEEIYPF